jgi:hypothetical protein
MPGHIAFRLDRIQLLHGLSYGAIHATAVTHTHQTVVQE